MSGGGAGFYESFLIVSYLVITIVIVSNLLLAVVLEVFSSSSRAKNHDELMQSMHTAASATATILAELQAKGSGVGPLRSSMEEKISPGSSPMIRSRRGSTRRGSIAAAAAAFDSRYASPLPPPMQLPAAAAVSSTSLMRSPSKAAAAATADAGTVLSRIGPWREMQAGDGDVYYWNKFTGVVTWTHPKQLPLDSQNPAVATVAAAVHRLKAKELKGSHGQDAAADMLAAAMIMRPHAAEVRSQAELSRFASADEDNVEGGDQRDSAAHGGADIRKAGSVSTGPSADVAAAAAGDGHADAHRNDKTERKKPSTIQMWYACTKISLSYEQS